MKLKPCPFCGGEAKVIDIGCPPRELYCMRCGARINRRNEKECVDAWNRRQVDWHVISKRPMTEEERKEWSEKFGYDVEYEDPFIYVNVPADGEDVILTTTWGTVVADCYCSDNDGAGFDSYELDEVAAWMPLPDPYKPEGGQE